MLLQSIILFCAIFVTPAAIVGAYNLAMNKYPDTRDRNLWTGIKSITCALWAIFYYLSHKN
jgi:hypothetical protein